MDDTLTTSAAPLKRNCSIEQVFDPNFTELIRLAPKNPFVRALILKLTGKTPAKECETFEQIKEWVESNCEKRAFLSRTGGVGIAVRVEFAETEYGRADYSVRRYGASNFEIQADGVMEIVDRTIGEGDGIDQIVETIAHRIEDDAWNQCEPELEDYGEYDYSDHESRDFRDGEVEFSRNQIKQSVLAFLRIRHPELADEL